MMTGDSSSSTGSGSSSTVMIVGAGLSGIAAAHECVVRGLDYIVVEMDDRIGGTWHTQNFPGIRADSLHIQNLFSFHPLPSDSITTGPWLREYLEGVADKYGISEHIRFHTKLKKINWDSTRSEWQAQLENVQSSTASTITSKFVVNANGYFDLHKPNVPAQFRDKPGFKSKIIHSAKMTRADDASIEGKNVVLVGSGATATTLVPELLRSAKTLTWVFRSSTHTVPLFRLPSLWARFHDWLIRLHAQGTTWPYRLYRFIFLSFIQGYMQAMTNVLPDLLVRWFYALWNGSSSQVFKKFFSPDYHFGYQRVCLFEDLQQTLANPRLKIIKGEVGEMEGHQLVVKDANNGGGNVAVADVDTVVLATGYDLNYFKFELCIDGKPMHMPDQVLRRELFFEDIPNFFFVCMFSRLAPRTTTSGTPGLEVTCKDICDIVTYVQERNYTSFTIKAAKDRTSITRLQPMKSNYITRNESRCFKGIPEESDDACRWRYMFWQKPFNSDEYNFST